MTEPTITIYVIDSEGNEVALAAPTDMGLSLMEFLKANEYDILATCGGMALCATCCIDILEGQDNLPEAEDNELDMLDTLPEVLPCSRLSCQLPITQALDGLKLKIHEE